MEKSSSQTTEEKMLEVLEKNKRKISVSKKDKKDFIETFTSVAQEAREVFEEEGDGSNSKKTTRSLPHNFGYLLSD